MSTTVESLELEILSSSQSAENGLDALINTLGRLKTAVKGGCGLTAVTNQLTKMNTALAGINSNGVSNLNALAKGLQALAGANNVKLSSTIATQLTNIGTATKSLNGVDFAPINNLASALAPLATVGQANLGSSISQLQKLPAAIQPLTAMDMGGVSTKIQELVNALKPLADMAKANLSSSLNQIKKLPEAFNTLNSIDLTSFAKKIKEVADAMKPLADEMQKVANGFSSFPAKIQKVLNSTGKIPASNNKASTSYVNLAAKIAVAYTALKRVGKVIASWINESNTYVENLNLFNASMKGYAAEAQEYAEQVGDIMGIDPSVWMRNQGVFMTLANLFGFSLPEVDYSGLTEVSGGAEDASDAIDEATGSAKELKKTLLGIDELNLMTDNSSGGGAGGVGGGGGGGFDFELPEYDFLGDLAESRVGQIVQEMKEWLGLTEDIDSWAELLDTRFGRILSAVGLIGIGIAAWKLTKGFLDGIAALKALLASPSYAIAIGLTLTLVGFTLEFSGIKDAIHNGLDGFNFGEILGGGLLGTGGTAILGSTIAKWITTAFAGSKVATALGTAASNLGLAFTRPALYASGEK